MKAEYLLPQPVLPEAFGDQAKGWPVYKPDPRFVIAPKGAINEGPDAYILVLAGACKPADEECRKAAGLTDSEILERYGRYKLLEKGELMPVDIEGKVVE